MLPHEYIDVARRLLRIHSLLTYRYNEVENLQDFPLHQYFNNVYSTERPSSDLFFALEAATRAAYTDQIQPLIPGDTLRIQQRRQVLW